MGETVRRIAIIPARSGSKGLPDKNIRPLCGKPLMAYSIEAAVNSGMFAKVFVSTDSDRYAEIAKEYGADASFLRSQENSNDHASSWDAVKEVIRTFESKGESFDEIMLLQPTSPLRNADDISESIRIMTEKKAKAVESVTEMEHTPLWSNTLPQDGCMDDFENPEWMNIPRQELPKYYRLNGAIYLVVKQELFSDEMFQNKCFAYIMPNERSVDIDSELDFELAEILLKKSEKI